MTRPYDLPRTHRFPVPDIQSRYHGPRRRSPIRSVSSSLGRKPCYVS